MMSQLSANEKNPRKLISLLCNHFYDHGWVSGTGGGMSIKMDGKIYIAPSGVQKEMISEDEIFVLNDEGYCLECPLPSKNLKLSECTPLFMKAYQIRNAGSVIHAHSINAVLATLVVQGNEFKISHQEMIKGIKKGSSDISHRFDETLIVPIIENTCFEADLAASMAEAIEKYPNSNAVLVRRHGFYVWGKTWKTAKTMAECYDYLFKLSVEMHKLRIQAVKES
ncbi:methylthioribulose-1-phosphate dehydratase [Brevipalpus obovatus]|uniref:methylthioribulose-1-phosphate dehydratase n=1 Tax=Brevipalpus obovatus TaxID=246614 RepID=UPI003D9DD7F9